MTDLILNFKEEELDDLAGQVQMLEQAKTKLEMSMAAQKKEHRRELSSKDDELEDARTSTQKKVCNFVITYLFRYNMSYKQRFYLNDIDEITLLSFVYCYIGKGAGTTA